MVVKNDPPRRTQWFCNPRTGLPITKKRSGKSEIPPRMTPVDFIQSLVRSEGYRKDYETLMKYKHEAEPWFKYEPKPGREWKEDDFRKYLEAERLNPLYGDQRRKLTDEEEEKYLRHIEAEKKFQTRWPDLRLPIPPDEAMKNPQKYLNYLCDAVEVIPPKHPFWPGGKFAFGKLLVVEQESGSEEKRERIIRAEDLWVGRYLFVRIDLSRSKNDILNSIALRVDRFQKSPWNLPIPLADSKISRPKGERTHDRRWLIWDTFNGEGKRNLRKTAEILSPKSFNIKSDMREMKEEAKKEYEERIARGEKIGKAMNWHDNRVGSAKAAKWRIEERKRMIADIRQAVSVCKRMVGSQKPLYI